MYYSGLLTFVSVGVDSEYQFPRGVCIPAQWDMISHGKGQRWAGILIPCLGYSNLSTLCRH